MPTFFSCNSVSGDTADFFQDHNSPDEHKHLIFFCGCDLRNKFLWATLEFESWHFHAKHYLNSHLNTICWSKKHTCPELTFDVRINIIPPYSICPNKLSLVNIVHKLSSKIGCNPNCHLSAISKRHQISKLIFTYILQICSYRSDSQFTKVISVKRSYIYLH